MFKAKNTDFTQQNILNPFTGLTPQDQKELANSWAGIFYKEVYSKIDESLFKDLYSEKGSRPNVPVRLLIGALCLKEVYHLNDQELIEQIRWNLQYQAALGVSKGQIPFTERTLTRFRRRLFDYEEQTGIDLVHLAIKGLLDNFCEKMGTDRSIKRMDSFMVSSNIKNLSRLEIIYETNRVGVRALNKEEVAIPELLEHYLKDYDSNQVFYYDKKLSYEQKCRLLIDETLETLELLKSSQNCQQELSLIERLISEQFIQENGKWRLKKDKSEGLNSQTMQSPHDPDASFREKGGAHCGYVANVEESACENGSMIEDYQYEQNTYSDQQFMDDLIQKEENHSKEEPLTVVTDGAYSSQKNQQKAQEKGITLVPTELAGRKTKDIHADFIFNEEGTEVLSCPYGVKPIRCAYYPNINQCRVVFKIKDCQNCPYRDKCRPKMQKKTAYKFISNKSVLRAQAKRNQKGETFNKLRNFRNGVEAVPAALREKFNIDRMPVRGLIRTRQVFGFKIGGLAFKKFLRFKDRQAQQQDKCA